tara:strand:+ start:747 stop:1259 length:513 start_codon:yes stop_codon:yes gene_type:complete
MEQNLESKIELKNKIINFYNLNKFKIYIFIFLLLSILTAITLIEYNNQKKNILISEKYIEAGMNLAASRNENAKLLYEEIILSKNKFYSILSLNAIIEKNLISDEKKILSYFEILENMNFQEEKYDLIIFKKALFYFKILEKKEGINLLEKLIEKNSKFRNLAEEITTNQ